MDKSDNKLGIGIVGCGAIARLNAEAIRLSSGPRLAGVMDPALAAAEVLGSKYGVPATDDLEELLGMPGVEAVFICAPHYLHAPLSEAAAAEGKHVIVEKPMGSSLEAARRIAAACDASDVSLSVCYCMRFGRKISLARDFARDGGLGAVAGIQVEMLRDRSESYSRRDTWQEGNADWHGIKAKSGGGMFLDNFSHYLDYFRHITGLEAVSVRCRALTRVIPADVEDTLWAEITYESGAVGTFIAAAAVPGAGREQDSRSVNSLQRIWGNEGQILLLPEFGLFSQRWAAGLAPNRWHYPRPRRIYAGGGAGASERTAFVESFAAAVAEGKPPAIGGEDGLRVMEIVDAAYRSAAGGGVEVEVKR